MRVLLTGAFGNVGESTLLSLFEKEHDILCFDIETSLNRKRQKELLEMGSFETVWGDITRSDDIEQVMKKIECIIHLAAIIPPASDANPEQARNVNVGGTMNLLNSAKKLPSPPKFIYASSIATYGHCKGDGPPKTANDLQVPTDCYTEHKIECESLLRNNGLPWTIVRFGVVTPLRLGLNMPPIMFDIPIEQRIEFVHTRDIGLACANAVTADTNGKILLLGGGECCRMTYRKMVSSILDVMGIGMLPDSAFITPKCDEDWFHTDYMDTEESQHLLQFQTRTFEQFLDELKHSMGIKRYLARLFKPLARRYILSKSPYYKQGDTTR
jgi:nucleoside-diphosphate-sugar epimerase